MVRHLQAEGFYGKLELDIQGGNVLRMIEHRSHKLEEEDEWQARSRER